MDQTWIKARRWGVGGVAAVLAAALVAACGGGGSGGGGSATASAFAAGPITGFGSIIVDGVRFDDSGAEIENEDGEAGGKGDLKLGSMVEIESEAIDDSTNRAKAVKIRFGSELVGPVESVAADASSFVAIGQTVDIKPETVIEVSLGPVSGFAGKVVEVHGQVDAANGHIVATRIEDKAGAELFKLRGVVAGLDTTNKLFTIGAATISYAGIADADLPAGFDNGLKVRVRLQTTQVGGNWVAVSIRSGVRKVEDHDAARLRGTVSAFTDATHFEVNGVPVDASAAQIDNGPVTMGAQVEVRGTAQNGTVMATRVKVLNENDDAVLGIELHGTLSDLNTTDKNFMLRGVKVDYSGSVVFKDGTEADLVEGAQVEVKGRLSDDRSTLAAASIEFGH